ncbi:MAG: 30S ribosomal protein S6 [Spirochaetia bacterium]|jgi:small subunit ribosomal protein S6|nr:30S ribosomal protein S6 [Spirochaetia bacterium]
MRKYEATFIFRTEEDKLAQAKEFVKSILESKSATVLKEEDQGERVLAYDIKKQSKGHYFYYELEFDPAKIDETEKEIKLNLNVLKFLFVRAE